MTHLFVLTEEPSLKIVLDELLGRLLPAGQVTFQVFPHQGKQDLEKALRTTVPSLSRMPGACILVTRDQDAVDCIELKKRLLDLLAPHCSAPFKVRILCRELENWFLGDLDAIQKTWPRFQAANFRQKALFRKVDAIGNAPQKLLKMIPEFAGRERLPKRSFSEAIAPHLDLERNSSTSFQHFFQAVRLLTNPDN